LATLLQNELELKMAKLRFLPPTKTETLQPNLLQDGHNTQHHGNKKTCNLLCNIAASELKKDVALYTNHVLQVRLCT